jgi:hypothetical protein
MIRLSMSMSTLVQSEKPIILYEHDLGRAQLSIRIVITRANHECEWTVDRVNDELDIVKGRR